MLVGRLRSIWSVSWSCCRVEVVVEVGAVADADTFNRIPPRVLEALVG